MRPLALLALALTLFLPLPCGGLGLPTLKVAIVDTGLDPSDPRFRPYMCPDGSWDFVRDAPLDGDPNGHGTHVAGLVRRNAPADGWCMMSIRVWDATGHGDYGIARAFRWASEHGARLVNLSGGGEERDLNEWAEIVRSPRTTYVVAAGNKGEDISHGGWYPAAYGLPNVVAVGGLEGGRRWSGSNYGFQVRAWEQASALSDLPGGREGWMTGTSMSAAIRTGKTIGIMQR